MAKCSVGWLTNKLQRHAAAAAAKRHALLKQTENDDDDELGLNPMSLMLGPNAASNIDLNSNNDYFLAMEINQ